MQSALRTVFLWACLLIAGISGIPVKSYAVYVSSGHSSPSPKEHEGYIVLKSGEILYGSVLMDQRKKCKPCVRLRTMAGKQFIPYDQIALVHVEAHDDLVMLQPYTEFHALEGRKGLWRMLATGRVNIYDDRYYVDEYPDKLGTEVLVEENGQARSIYDAWSFDAKADLLKYLNGRSSVHYKRRDFKNTRLLLVKIVEE